ncbi:MAG: hypothetical protein H5U06_11440 [Candidatus Aminicenantes bacterium]|nr:hypothetical protein [Candidatus Aminicenantes bacterium]
MLAIILTLKIYLYKEEIYSLDYGLPAYQLLEPLKKWINWSSSGLYVIFIFNSLPSESAIEEINKLSMKNRKDVNFYSIFHKRFRGTDRLIIPYKFIPNKRTKCYYQDELFDRNYFLIFNNERLIFAGKYLNPREIHFYLLKQKAPDKPLSEYFINAFDYRKKIIRKLREGNNQVYKIDNDHPIKIGNLINIYNEIYFINADCSECELKGILSGMSRNSVINDIKPCLIFSFFANTSLLKNTIKVMKINIPVFFDHEDAFDVANLIIEGQQKSIRLTREEILEGEQ